MSSNGENFTTATITSLPTELIVKIVRLSSPKPSWDTATERSTHLRNLALVCQAMRGPAQEELFRHIVLRSISASRLFVAVLKSRAGARFASTPRSLRAGVAGKDWIEQEKLALPYITKRCSRLESLWLFEVDALDVAGLVSGTDSYDGDVISLIEFVNSLGGQLSSLCINYQDVKGFRIQSELLTSLQILDIGLPLDDLPPFLSSIPSHIRHFRAEPSQSEDPLLTDHAWATKLITQYLGDDKYQCIKNLEHFRLPSYYHDPKVVGASVLEAELSALRPDVRISFDDERIQDDEDVHESMDSYFNPAFWALVDDAEAEEEERRRLEGI